MLLLLSFDMKAIITTITNYPNAQVNNWSKHDFLLNYII